MPEDWRTLVDSDLFKVDTSKVPEVRAAVQQLLPLPCACAMHMYTSCICDIHFVMSRMQLALILLSSTMHVACCAGHGIVR